MSAREDSQHKDRKRAASGYNDYLRYSGLGLQMAAIIGLCIWGGWWLDGMLAWKVPVATILGALVGLVGSMVLLFKETRPKDR